jgi:uncharacterized membrane protein
MTYITEEQSTCQVCGQKFSTPAMMAVATMRHAVVQRISRDHPGCNVEGYICQPCSSHYRAEYVHDLLQADHGELSTLDNEVLDALRDQEIIASNLNDDFGEKSTFGQRIADHVAAFGGSWSFIILFGGIITAWIAVNATALLSRPFDPYPYILLNLVLSTLAAFQAPVIMMSQNRQSAKDRLQAEHDYQVNLKAELEIRLLHTKLDQLLTHQWQRLIEIQQLQMDLMEEIRSDHK